MVPRCSHAVRKLKRVSLLLSVVWLSSAVLHPGAVRGAVLENLQLLRDRCLCYAAGHAPADTNTVTLRNGLYAQSPFSLAGEVDLAASGFSLAALPAAVANGIINSNAAQGIAAEAARQVRRMVVHSAGATNLEQIRRYGYGGMLCHYPVWNAAAGEYQAQPYVEFSSIDTTLLLYGLMVSANYFGGSVRADFEGARDAVRWKEWLDTATPGHQNQFHMSYRPEIGFFAWWDWYTQEGMLVGIFASMSERSVDPVKVWRGWRRNVQTYTSPGPEPRTFTCATSYFGDPFTVVYGLAFLDFARFPLDVDQVNWFQQGQTAYAAHIEFFQKERGYQDNLTAGFSICAPNGAMARPNGVREEPIPRSDATVYTLAGGLPYYGDDPASNPLARALSGLVTNTPGFFGWHGWPAATVNGTNAAHEVVCDRIVGQDIVFVGLAIDNYLSRRAPELVSKDPAMRRTLDRIFPPQTMRSVEAASDAGKQPAVSVPPAHSPSAKVSGLPGVSAGSL